MKINEYLKKLNNEQKRAVLDASQVCMVNASVGSGKTTVLTNKVLYILDELNVPTKDLVVLTFTNKAANEIKERVNALFTNDIEMKYFGTFHSVAMKLLKEELKVEELGFTTNFTIITPEEEAELANEIIEENSLNIKYRKKIIIRLEKYEYGILNYGLMKKNDDIDLLVKLLKKRKIKENQLSFADLLYFSIEQLNKGYYKAKWVVVDEFQDCDVHQLDFINALTDKNTHIFVVGDPNQVIYSWRGGNCNVFDEFKNKYSCKELSLPINYRSTASILDVAKVFLKKDCELEGVRDIGNKIIVNNHYDAFQEAQYLAEQIKNKVTDNELQYKDIAILYRMQKQSEIIEQVFTKNKIPFEVSLKKTVNDIPVLRWFIKLLKYSINNNDSVSYYAVFCDNEFGPNMSKTLARRNLDNIEKNELKIKCENFKSFLVENEINIKNLYDYYELDKYIYPSSSTFEENKKHIIKFVDEIDKFSRENNLTGFDCIINFLNSSSLYGINLLNEQVNLSSNSVKLMTLHASKGLEFKQVYIIGVNWGLIPMICKNDEEEAEEKRLFFVGITRAKDNLEMSYYTNTSNEIFPGPSRYITMIPRNLIVNADNFIEHTSNMQSLKRNLFENKHDGNDEIINGDKELYIHNKYGIGEKILEDANIITINFKGYGEKSFFKIFNEVKKYEKQ